MGTRGGSISISSFLSSSYLSRKTSISTLRMSVGKFVTLCQRIVCSAVQESSTPTVAAETKEMEVAKAAEVAAPEKPKPPAKAPAKALPELMEEDVIPSLKETLGSQDDISELELYFEDNKLEGSFLKKGYPYSFWAFFPDGVLTGPKGFSLSSYGYEASTVEPFLIDEKKITAKHGAKRSMLTSSTLISMPDINKLPRGS